MRRFRGVADELPFLVGVTGGADHQICAIGQRRFDDLAGERMDGEIDHASRAGDRGIEIFTGIMGGRNGHPGQACGFKNGMAHAAGFSSNEK